MVIYFLRKRGTQGGEPKPKKEKKKKKKEEKEPEEDWEIKGLQ
jgi:hypothetical protein